MNISRHGLRTAIYKVSDIQKAKDWYTQAFGVAPYFDEPFYVGFNVGGYELGLQENPTPVATKTAHVAAYWGVDDVAEEVARFVALGATVLEEPVNVGGPIVVGLVQDPWGNAIGLIYNPTFQV